MHRFSKKVFALVRKIPKGKVSTYKALSEKTNLHPRTIGQILKTNPDPIKTPCHRVVKSNGSLGGYFGNQTRAKAKILQKEGIEIEIGKIDLEKYLYKF